MDANPRILIVDDDESTSRTLSLVFGRKGYDTETATTGQEAIEKAQERFFNLALLDIKLPDMEGIELLAPLKELQPDMVAIMITAYASLGTAVQALNGGVSAYITKPLNMDEVLATVREALEKQRLLFEKRRMEEALRRSKREWETTFDAMADWVSLLDLDARILRTNRAGEELMGVPLSEIIGQTCCKSVHGSDRPIPGCPLQRMLHTHQRETAEFQMPDGNRWLTITVDPVMDQDGNLFRAVHIVRDITDRKQAEEEIRRHLERIQALREVDRAITSTLDLTEVLDTILEELERVIPYHSAGIFLFSDSTAKLVAGRGFPYLERALQVAFPVEEDALTRELLQEKRPLILADAQANERFQARGGTEYVRSWIGVPLTAKGRMVGFLTIDHREPGVYDEESADMAEAFGSQVAIAIENARLYEDAQRELAERKRAEQLLRTLNAAAVAMERALTHDEIFVAVAEEFKKLGLSCVVFLTDESQSSLLVKHWSYQSRALRALEKLVGLKIEDFSISIETTDVYREAISKRKPIFVEDVEGVIRQLLPEPINRFAGQIVKILGISKSIPTPLIVGDDVIGLLSVESDDLTEEDIPAITAFANQMAAAWHKANLMQDLEISLTEREQAQAKLQQSHVQLQKTFEGMVNVLVSTIEMKDPYTAGHQRRVTRLARAIAREMGLPQERIEGLRMAGLIHDLGKITIPAEILSKPGQLSDIEWGLIKAHPKVGHNILKAVEFPWPVAEIVLQHHERLDGSGYPQGLSGEEIMLEARILAVADVVEAMASFRPYRPARGIDKALEEIWHNRGVLYDPEVVDVCLKLFTEKGFKFE